MLTLALAALAHAGTLTVGATGGSDYATRNWYTGVEVALHPDNREGLAAIGSITPAFGFGDQLPLALFEVGFVHVVPTQQAVTRVGIISRNVVLAAPYRLPLGTSGDTKFGIVPGFVLHAEFEYNSDGRTPVVFTAEGGMTSAMYDFQCQASLNPNGCISWAGGFLGGFGLAARVNGKLYLSGMVGTKLDLAIGYAF